MRLCDRDIWDDLATEPRVCGLPGYAVLNGLPGKPTVCKSCFKDLEHNTKPHLRDWVKDATIIAEPERSAVTVNQLIVQLHRLRELGRGENLVFLAMDGRDWCPRFDRTKEYHTASMGHVVLFGEKYREEWDEAPVPPKPVDFVQRIKRRPRA